MILKKLIIYFKGKKFRWNKESSGVGRLSTEGLDEFFEIYKQELGTSTNAELRISSKSI
jgi:hypothetical protein